MYIGVVMYLRTCMNYNAFEYGDVLQFLWKGSSFELAIGLKNTRKLKPWDCDGMFVPLDKG